MKMLSGSHRSFLSRSKQVHTIMSILAICGTFIVLAGGVWDSASHELRIPDTFWTIQHITIYFGASIVALSALIGIITIVKGVNRKIHTAIIIIVIGTIAQLVGGYFDYEFHTQYGIDGLVTPSHMTIETGLLLSSLGGVMLLSKNKNKFTSKIIPISIMTVILSASWIGFNLSLLLGAIVECVPIYQMFSSGCAVM